jgi:hypothetical protein
MKTRVLVELVSTWETEFIVEHGKDDDPTDLTADEKMRLKDDARHQRISDWSISGVRNPNQ